MTSTLKVDQIQLVNGNAPTAADLGFAAGSVLQVVSSEFSTNNVTTQSGTYTSTGLSCSITPTSTSSKILTTVMAVGVYKSAGAGAVGLRLSDGTNAYEFETLAAYDGATGSNGVGTVGYQRLWSPSSTSQQTYTLEFAAPGGTGTAYINARWNNSYAGTRSTMVLMEIAG